MSIRGKLEVLPGGVINIPGCEPTSAASSITLEVNRQCTASVITLERAKELIPNATMEMWHNPIRWFFVLPDGPPTQPGCSTAGRACGYDWYQVLRDGAVPFNNQSADEDSGADGGCNPFSIGMFGGL